MATHQPEDKRSASPLAARLVQPPLEALIAKWREAANVVLSDSNPRRSDEASVRANRAYNNAIQMCADELEAALQAGRLVDPSPLPNLDSREFYEVMQAYRHAPVDRPGLVVEHYEAVKAWLRVDKGINRHGQDLPQPPTGDKSTT